MSSVVVLTQSMGYWGERSLKDVIKLYFRGKIQILESDKTRTVKAGISRDGVVFKMPYPLVVMLSKFDGFKIKKDKISYSDPAVYERDDNICQYWHKDEKGKRFKYRCSNDERTIDHVVPKQQGGTNSFTNCVCCCREHNEKVKKNRTPIQAGMELIRQPREPVIKKGEKIWYLSFSFNPNSEAHKAYYEYCGYGFSHVAS